MRLTSLFPFLFKNKKQKKNALDLNALSEKIKGDLASGVSSAPRSVKLIVTLTSFPARIDDVAYTVYSLLSQTVQPDAVVLWLAKEQFPGLEKDLPDLLLLLRQKGLTLRWTKDIRSYKKLIPSLSAFPDAVLVTADDDVFYPSDWLERLYAAHQKHPDCVLCHRAHMMLFDKSGAPLPYKKWRRRIPGPIQKNSLVFTGVGGVLFPPHRLYSDILKETLFMSLAPHADDLWFWAMTVLQGTPIRVISNNLSKALPLCPDTEGPELSNYNLKEGGNDKQLQSILSHYPNLIRMARDS